MRLLRLVLRQRGQLVLPQAGRAHQPRLLPVLQRGAGGHIPATSGQRGRGRGSGTAGWWGQLQSRAIDISTGYPQADVVQQRQCALSAPTSA